MQVLRTPDARFDALEDFAFAAHYRDVDTDDGTALRLHFVDEGPRDAAPVLLLHGNPSWSYLYRHMIPGLVARGHRVVAPDLMGMGRSDKPDDPAFYSLERHVEWLRQFVEGEDLRDMTVFCQDWGGIIALVLLARSGERVARVVASNTGLPAGEGVNRFMEQWLAYSQSVDYLPAAALVDSGTTRSLSAGERAAYDAPYPDGTYQASPKVFPLLIPLQPDNPGVPLARATWGFLETWDRPFLTVFGSEDQIAYKPGAHRKLQRVIPGAQGQPHRVVEGAGHFIQEDAAELLVDVIDEFVGQEVTS